MLFAIHALDCENGLTLREKFQQAHLAHLEQAGNYGVKLVMTGPLVEDDGSTLKGSLLVVEADSRTEVTAFNSADPFTDAGVWEAVTITAFQKRRG
jgi:uncharacterized protein